MDLTHQFRTRLSIIAALEDYQEHGLVEGSVENAFVLPGRVIMKHHGIETTVVHWAESSPLKTQLEAASYLPWMVAKTKEDVFLFEGISYHRESNRVGHLSAVVDRQGRLRSPCIQEKGVYEYFGVIFNKAGVRAAIREGQDLTHGLLLAKEGFGVRLLKGDYIGISKYLEYLDGPFVGDNWRPLLR